MAQGRPYHHGNLRAALLDAATEEIDAVGPAAMSLRRVATRAGVTHPAVAHHFGDKTGLLTALASRGHEHLNAALRAAGGLLQMGVAYVRFAAEHRAEFEVMFRPELLHGDDPDLVAARAAGRTLLRGGASEVTGAAATSEATQEVALAAWSMVHGFASLWLAGDLPGEDVEDAVRLFRRSARRAFSP